MNGPRLAAWGIASAMALRVTLDLFWWVELPWANLPRTVSGALALAAVALTIAGAGRLRGLSLVWPTLAFVALLAVGLARAPDLSQGSSLLVQYGSPPVIALACAAWLRERGDADRLALAVGFAGLVPVAVSLVLLVAGQPAEHVLHDYPRLIGGYRNLHAHALAMAFLCTLGLYLALQDRSRVLGAVLAIGAGAALAATWVRTGQVFVALVVGIWLVQRRRWRLLLALAAATVVLVSAVPPLRARFADVTALMTLSAPAQGWDWIGSGRFGIWRKSLMAFVDLGPVDVLLGTGLGGHRTFWRGINPHNDYLLLLYQLGPLGVLAYLAALGTALRLAWRAAVRGADPVARYAVALAASALVVNALSNTFVSRLTVAWLLWALVGAAIAAGQRVSEQPGETGPAAEPGGQPGR